jgi:hypothetical protein
MWRHCGWASVSCARGMYSDCCYEIGVIAYTAKSRILITGAAGKVGAVDEPSLACCVSKTFQSVRWWCHDGAKGIR